MRKIVLTILVALVSFSFLSFANSEDLSFKNNKGKTSNETELNFFSGMFDFSDDNQASGLIGLQHQNDELFIEADHGRFSPITGAFITAKNAFYVYTGVQAEYQFGSLAITPSFAPGYYNAGSGKDLGYPLEFKTEIQMPLDLSDSTQ